MRNINKLFSSFFGVIFQRQTYLNLLYVIFTFPLGTAYFLFLTSGLLVGLSFSIIIIGLPVLLLVLVAWLELVNFERELATRLLGVDIPPLSYEEKPLVNFWSDIKNRFVDPTAWKGMMFLFIKFPFGIFTLIILAICFTLTLGLIFAPFTTIYWSLGNSKILIDSLPEALLTSILGIIIAVCTLHITNILAAISGSLAKIMLGKNNSSVHPDTLDEQKSY
ncbi:sensor domain-containing protein [Methanohalophilus profundi]|uniref:sensor domain-containing protein n=1 Tax=Methanohalophilus profundi TaxID=2138083 RepID=UPI00101C5F79|nr:sensor domain-containing protein [Methanohalophilus profundi]